MERLGSLCHLMTERYRLNAFGARRSALCRGDGNDCANSIIVRASKPMHELARLIYL